MSATNAFFARLHRLTHWYVCIFIGGTNLLV